MVQAVKAIFIKCDVPTKVYIQHLNDNRPSSDKIVIEKPGLDETTLLIKDKHLEYVKEELKKHKQSITYQKPDPKTL